MLIRAIPLETIGGVEGFGVWMGICLGVDRAMVQASAILFHSFREQRRPAIRPFSGGPFELRPRNCMADVQIKVTSDESCERSECGD